MRRIQRIFWHLHIKPTHCKALLDAPSTGLAVAVFPWQSLLPVSDSMHIHTMLIATQKSHRPAQEVIQNNSKKKLSAIWKDIMLRCNASYTLSQIAKGCANMNYSQDWFLTLSNFQHLIHHLSYLYSNYKQQDETFSVRWSTCCWWCTYPVVDCWWLACFCKLPISKRKSSWHQFISFCQVIP
jgi:hypothetical protein